MWTRAPAPSPSGWTAAAAGVVGLPKGDDYVKCVEQVYALILGANRSLQITLFVRPYISTMTDLEHLLFNPDYKRKNIITVIYD